MNQTQQDAVPMSEHGMVPGSHERAYGPECRCGSAYDYWNDRCVVAPYATPHTEAVEQQPDAVQVGEDERVEALAEAMSSWAFEPATNEPGAAWEREVARKRARLVLAALPSLGYTEQVSTAGIEVAARRLFEWDIEEHPEPKPSWSTLTEAQQDVWRSGARAVLHTGPTP